MRVFRRYFIVLLFFITGNQSSSQTITRLNGSTIDTGLLNSRIHQLVNAADVHGLAITIFNNNHNVYTKTFGHKRYDLKQPIGEKTNFYGASLSKAVFGVLVLKLVEEGVLQLDKPLQQYLPKPIYTYKPKTRWHDDYSDLVNDTQYHKITARMCVDHTTGFSNWRWNEPDQKLRVHGEPGTRYNYSGEGMVYLQVVLELITGKSLEQMARHYIFEPLGMKQTSYTWQPRFENDYVVGHHTDGTLYKKDKDNEARAASTLETTLYDYALFLEAILSNRIISAASTKEMFTPQVLIRSVKQFGPLSHKDSTANDAIELAYGLGWGLLQSPYGTGAFKEGHGDGFQHYSILFPQQKMGVLLMSNSDNAESIFKYLLEITIGDSYTPWYWENYIPYDAYH